MSAIAGVYRFDGRPVESACLEEMLARLVHRGPHGLGIWTEGVLGLAHRMLWSTPESQQEKLPLHNRQKNVIITADARVDNRDELFVALDIETRDMGDSELILRAYERWGEQCPERLVGDFAFAVWDARKQTLFCARDPFGVKPLYYIYLPRRMFAFASEIKALLCIPEVPQRLNEILIADLFVPALDGLDRNITYYKDILKLSPGCSAVVDRTRMATRTYWSLDPARELRFRSEDEYVEGFCDSFSNAVRCRLRSASGVGVMLSGGLDSCSILGVTSKLLSDMKCSVHALSCVSENPAACPEGAFIRAALEDKKIAGEEIRPSQVDGFAADFDRMLWHVDEPVDLNRQYIPRIIYRLAQNMNVCAVLDGVDGDVTASHEFEYVACLLRAGRWKELSSQVMGISVRLNESPWRVFRSYALRPLTPPLVVKVWDRLHGRQSPPWADTSLLQPQFARRIGLSDRVKLLNERWAALARTAREDQWRILTWGHIPFSLEAYDRAAAAFSVEARHPFLDQRLVQFCLALPPEQKLDSGWTKMILRRAMAGIVPDRIRWRTDKPNLTFEFFTRLIAFEDSYIRDAMVNGIDCLSQYLRVERVQEAYRRYTSGGGTPADAGLVWTSTTLFFWLQRRFNGIQTDGQKSTGLGTRMALNLPQ